LINHIKKKHEGEGFAEVTVAETDMKNSVEPDLDNPDNEDPPEVGTDYDVNATTRDDYSNSTTRAHGVIIDTSVDDVKTTSRGDDLNASNRADATIWVTTLADPFDATTVADTVNV